MRIRPQGQPTGPPVVLNATPAGPPPPPKPQVCPWRPSRAGILHLVAVWVIVVLAWSLAHDRLTRESWRVPLSYSGDGLQMLTWIQAASEFDYVPFASRTNSRLGAPHEANWNDYPMY